MIHLPRRCVPCVQASLRRPLPIAAASNPHPLPARIQPRPTPFLRTATTQPSNISHYCSSSTRSSSRQHPMASASDEDYAAFLDRANANPSSGRAATKSSSSAKPKQFTASSVNTDVPSALSRIDRDYTSESDERFEAVSLAFDGDGDALRVEDVRALTGHDEVEALEVKTFDPRGEYGDVVDAVAQAGSGKAKVFRIALGGARCEYWVLSVDAKGKRVVGLRAGAVES